VLLLPEKLSALTAIATDPVTVTPSDGLVIVTVNREFATTTEVEVLAPIAVDVGYFSAATYGLPFGNPRSDGVPRRTSLRFLMCCASRSRCDRGTAQTCLNCRWCRMLPCRGYAAAKGRTGRRRTNRGRNGGVSRRRQYASCIRCAERVTQPSPSACAVTQSDVVSQENGGVPTMSGFTPSLSVKMYPVPLHQLPIGHQRCPAHGSAFVRGYERELESSGTANVRDKVDMCLKRLERIGKGITLGVSVRSSPLTLPLLAPSAM